VEALRLQCLLRAIAFVRVVEGPHPQSRRQRWHRAATAHLPSLCTLASIGIGFQISFPTRCTVYAYSRLRGPLLYIRGNYYIYPPLTQLRNACFIVFLISIRFRTLPLRPLTSPLLKAFNIVLKDISPPNLLLLSLLIATKFYFFIFFKMPYSPIVKEYSFYVFRRTVFIKCMSLYKPFSSFITNICLFNINS